MVEGGSPYANLIMPSPGQPRTTWPASPSLPGPSPSRAMVPSPGHAGMTKDADLSKYFLLPSLCLIVLDLTSEL